MKQLLVLAGFAVLLSGLAGCKSADRRIDKVIDGDRQFPEFLAGEWEAEMTNNSKWAFKFENDGSISKITHVLAGEVDLEAGGSYMEGREGTFAVFVMGPCEAEYDENTRELSVKIILEHYNLKLRKGQLEGKSHDYFEGPVSEDGNTWKAGWKSYAWLEGATPPDANVIEANPVPLVFTKVDTE
jgi:hypothetical protein